jgi:hypothetical protein
MWIFLGLYESAWKRRTTMQVAPEEAITEAKKHTDQDNSAGKNANASGTRRLRTEANMQTDQDKERIHSQ